MRVKLNVDDLTPVFREVLDTLAPRELEVQDLEGRWFLLRVRPYRTADNKIDGVVVALMDIDQLRRTGQELRTASDFARSVIEGVPLPLAVIDFNLQIRTTNEAFCKLSGLDRLICESSHLPSLAGSLWGLGEPLRDRLEGLRVSGNTVGERFEFTHIMNGSPVPRSFTVCGSVLQPHDEQFVLVTIQETTTHRESERALTAERDDLQRQVEGTSETLRRTQTELRALAASLFTSQEEERRRIARELHDDISQRLAAIEIDGVEAENQIKSATAKEAMQRIRTRLSQLSDDVRTMSHRLHPSILEDLGLTPALRSLTEEFGRRENMIATFSSREVPEIPLEVATALYRITQEALRNISKHAGQTHARVSLRGTPEGVQLQVADFGQGFDMESRRSGLGLLSMEERARQIGATLRVQSSLGDGTRITVDVPLPGAPGGE